MKILNKNLLSAIEEGLPLKLELGGGMSKRPGFFSLDQLESPETDAITDLNQPLDKIPDNSVQSIYSRHTLEHVSELLPLMKEIFRVTRSDGTIEIVVPHFSNVYGYSDPTHVRFFGLYTMNYFMGSESQQVGRKVPSFYSDVRFKNLTISIEFYRSGLIDRLFSRVFTKLVNKSFKSQEFYERRLCHFFHAWQIRYTMQPDKP